MGKCPPSLRTRRHIGEDVVRATVDQRWWQRAMKLIRHYLGDGHTIRLCLRWYPITPSVLCILHLLLALKQATNLPPQWKTPAPRRIGFICKCMCSASGRPIVQATNNAYCPKKRWLFEHATQCQGWRVIVDGRKHVQLALAQPPAQV